MKVDTGLKTHLGRLVLLVSFRFATIRWFWILICLLCPIALGIMGSHSIALLTARPISAIDLAYVSLRTVSLVFPFQAALIAIIIVVYTSGESRQAEDLGIITGLPLRHSLVVFADFLVAVTIASIQFLVLDITVIVLWGNLEYLFTSTLFLGLSLSMATTVVSLLLVLMIMAMIEVIPSTIAFFVLPLTVFFWNGMLEFIVGTIGLDSLVLLCRPDAMVSLITILGLGFRNGQILFLLFPQSAGSIAEIVTAMTWFVGIVCSLVLFAWITYLTRRYVM